MIAVQYVDHGIDMEDRFTGPDAMERARKLEAELRRRSIRKVRVVAVDPQVYL